MRRGKERGEDFAVIEYNRTENKIEWIRIG